jgi:hypothetical protein
MTVPVWVLLLFAAWTSRAHGLIACCLAIILLLARITQSLLHIGPTQTESVAGARFGFSTRFGSPA